MRLFLITIAVVAGAFMAACGDDDTGDSTATPDASGPLPTPTPAVTEPGDPCNSNLAGPAASEDLTWDAIVPAEIPAPEGWTVSDAEGDAPLLAVNDGTAVVGTLELLQFEVPFNPAGGYPNLEFWANHEYATAQVDREALGLTIALDPVISAAFGDFCGVSYGFTVTDDAGVVSERFVARATFDSGKLYLVTAFYDGIDQATGFQSAEALAAFEPSLSPLVEALNVPAD